MKKAEQECHMLSEEAKRGVRNLRIDFERAGIHICPGIHITSSVMLCSKKRMWIFLFLSEVLYMMHICFILCREIRSSKHAKY